MNLVRHYRTLGLRRGASLREVKGAYRTLVRQYHPDINPDEAAVEQFIKINDAYTILSESMQVESYRHQDLEAKTQGKKQDTSRRAAGDISPDDIAQHEKYQDGRQDDIAQSAGRSVRQSPVANDEPAEFDSRLNNIRLNLEKLGFDSLPEANESRTSVHGPFANSRQSVNAQSVNAQSVNAQSVKVQSVHPSAQEEHLKQDTYQQLKGLLKQQKFPRAIALIEGLAHRMPQDAEIVQWQAIVYQRWGRQLINEGQTHKARIYLKKALRTDPNNRSLWREVNRDFWQLASLGS